MSAMPNFEPIPDPEPPLPHDHAWKGHVEEANDTYKPGWTYIDTDRVDAVQWEDKETGEPRQISDLEADPEDPDHMYGTYIAPDREPIRVRMSRHIHESKDYLIKHKDEIKKGTEVAAAAVAVAGVVKVASLIVRKRRKKD